jgi:hypothetical protein
VGEAAITPVLVTRLLNDVGDNPDQLSILQHALNRSWANWENECNARGSLDLPHYEAVGGMADALNRHAERAFSELGSDERKHLAERLFKALTDKVTDPRGIRRPTRLTQLCAISGARPHRQSHCLCHGRCEAERRRPCREGREGRAAAAGEGGGVRWGRDDAECWRAALSAGVALGGSPPFRGRPG